MDARLEEIDAIFLDLDGTIYLGGELIEGALEFLQRCEDRGVRRFFLSNNSSRSVSQYQEKLIKFNIPAEQQDIQLQIDLIFRRHVEPKGRRVEGRRARKAGAIASPGVITSTDRLCVNNDIPRYAMERQKTIDCRPTFAVSDNRSTDKFRCGIFFYVQKICAANMLVPFRMMAVEAQRIDVDDYLRGGDVLGVVTEGAAELVERTRQPTVAKMLVFEIDRRMTTLRVDDVLGSVDLRGKSQP